MTYLDELGDDSVCVYHCGVPRTTSELRGTGLPGRILFVDPRSEVTGDSPSAYLASSGLLEDPYDLVILRGSDQTFLDQVRRDGGRVRGLLAGTPAIAIVGGHSNRYRKPRTVSLSGGKSPPLPVLRALEMRGIVAARNALLEDEGAHFQLGSGYHQATYVRVRDALDDLHDLSRITDWILPAIDARCALLGSRRSLTPLLLAIQYAALDRFGWKIPAATLDSYPRTFRSVSRTVAELVGSSGRHVAVILSVDRDAQQERLILTSAPRHSRAVTLVDISDPAPAAGDALAHIPIPRWRVDADTGLCGDLCKGHEIVALDPDSEERHPVPPRSLITVSSVLFKDLEPFWEAVSNTGALRLHRDIPWPEEETGRERHRPVDIDLTRLLVDEQIWTTCLSRLAAMPPSDVVLIPDHEGTETLLRLIEEAQPDALPIVVGTGRISEFEMDTLHSASRVLVLDDAVVTGRTVRRILHEVRDWLGDKDFAQKDFRVFVPLLCAARGEVARSVHNAVARGAKGSIEEADTPRFVFAYNVPLPEDEPCPWCEELRLLEALVPKHPRHAELLQRRIEILADQSGDPNSLLLHPGAVDPEEDVIEDSVVGEDIDVGVVFAAFASAVQRLRYDAPPAGTPEHFLDLPHLVSNWWGVGMFAGVLRTISEAEGKYAALSDKLREAWATRERTWRDRELFEFVWAAFTDRIPVDARDMVLAAARKRRAKSELIAFAHDILAERLAR